MVIFYDDEFDEDEPTREKIIQILVDCYDYDEADLKCYDMEELEDLLQEAKENDEDHSDLFPNGDEYDE